MRSIVSTISSGHQIIPRLGPIDLGSQDSYFISAYPFKLSSVTPNLVACNRPLVSAVLSKDGRANFAFSNGSGFVVNTCPIQSSPASLSQRSALTLKRMEPFLFIFIVASVMMQDKYRGANFL